MIMDLTVSPNNAILSHLRCPLDRRFAPTSANVTALKGKL